MDDVKISEDVLEKVKSELRSNLDNVAKESRGNFANIIAEITESAKKEVEAERANFAKELATYRANTPSFMINSRDELVKGDYRRIAETLIQNRALTVNGASYETITNDIVAALSTSGNASDMGISFFYANAENEVVPLFSPQMAEPAGQTEGGTGISPDATGVLTKSLLTLVPYISILPVSNGASLFTMINEKLPQFFQDAFRRTIAKQICQGNGSSPQFTGLCANSSITQVNCTTTGKTVKWLDLIKAIKTLKGAYALPDVNGIKMLINPAIVSLVLGNSANDSLSMGLTSEYLMRNTLNGVPVIETGYAPTDMTTNGNPACVVGYMPHYALGLAKTFKLIPIPVTRTDNVEWNGIMYLMGQPMINSSFVRLNIVT